MKKLSRFALCLALLAPLSVTALADTVRFNSFADGFESVGVTLKGPNAPLTATLNAGGLLASVNAGTALLTFSVDPYQSVSFGGAGYSGFANASFASLALPNPRAGVDLGRLFAGDNDLSDSVSQAAFQIAVWEIAFETSGKYSLKAGSALFEGGTADTSGALKLASSWLQHLPAAKNGAPLGLLSSIYYQDQVYAVAPVTAVPELSSVGLMVAGLLFGSYLLRQSRGRRKQAGAPGG